MGTQWFQYRKYSEPHLWLEHTNIGCTYGYQYATTECAILSKWVLGKFHVQVTWVNNRHLAMPPFFSLQSVVRGTSTEIPYWWCVTSLIWVALLICPAKSKICFWTNQKHHPYLGSNSSLVWNFCGYSSNITSGQPVVGGRSNVQRKSCPIAQG